MGGLFQIRPMTLSSFPLRTPRPLISCSRSRRCQLPRLLLARGSFGGCQTIRCHRPACLLSAGGGHGQGGRGGSGTGRGGGEGETQDPGLPGGSPFPSGPRTQSGAQCLPRGHGSWQVGVCAEQPATPSPTPRPPFFSNCPAWTFLPSSPPLVPSPGHGCKTLDPLSVSQGDGPSSQRGREDRMRETSGARLAHRRGHLLLLVPSAQALRLGEHRHHVALGKRRPGRVRPVPGGRATPAPFRGDVASHRLGVVKSVSERGPADLAVLPAGVGGAVPLEREAG